MLLVKPSAEILMTTYLPLNLIEKAGRTCYKSEDKITETSNVDFAAMILKRGHESVVEHASATVRFVCDRGVTHEIVRHRLASYSQESTRYCDYSGGHVAFVIPPWVDIPEGEYNEEIDIDRTLYDCEHPRGAWLWASAMLKAEQCYKDLRENVVNWKPEQARSILPNSLKTEIVMTANLREWRHFFKLRTSAAAHPQMREVATPLLAEMKARIPVIFEDL
jgi:thymidylate synthase (FAD)